MEIMLILVGLNAVSFLLMAYDKYQAIKRKWRISEYTFFVLSCLGGWVGILMAMRFIHHKSKKTSFFIKIMLGVIISLFAVAAICKNVKEWEYLVLYGLSLRLWI